MLPAPGFERVQIPTPVADGIWPDIVKAGKSVGTDATCYFFR